MFHHHNIQYLLFFLLQKQRKHEQLVWRLQGVLHSADSDPRTIQEVLDYFLQRLTSTQLANRQLAVKVRPWQSRR